MPEPPKLEPILVGGRYMLYGEIAAGGMATVHIGRQLGTAGFSRTVAIKRLQPQFARDPEFVSMIVDEARLVARIRHPNVVPTLDIVAADGQLLLVMEYVPGESLARLVRSMRIGASKVPPRIASAIVAGALNGLHAAHEATDERGQPLHLVHRDVSPQNVLVGSDGVARMIDFGVAKAAGRIQSTREGKVKGKFAYMAPEQLSTAGVTRQTDVYAAAVVLWETLTCERLFDGDSEAVVLGRVLQGKVQPPSHRLPAISPELDEVTMRGLDRDPGRRFKTAREMALALETACPPATATEVGAWVEASAAPALARRARGVAEIESSSSVRGPTSAHEIISQMSTASVVPPPPAQAVDPIERGASTQYAATYSSKPPSPSSPPPSVPPAAPLPSMPLDGDGRRSSRVAFIGAAVLGVIVATVGVGLFMTFMSHPSGTAETPPGASETASAAASPSAAASAAAQAACPAGMVPIPGGKFFMGSDDDLPFERPAHKVLLSAFCIDAHEVTNEKYKACSDQGECKRAGRTNDWAGITKKESQVFDVLCNIREPVERAKHPINCVDWSMASTYCMAHGARLPTEAEWEFAARGPDGRKYPWGDDAPSATFLNACGKECVQWGLDNGIEESAMYDASDNWATTAPVGSFPAGKSRYGVYDVVGNVWEWVADWYAPYTAGEQKDPTGPAGGDGRVIRGGAWNGAQPAWVRPTFRYHDAPMKRSYGIGFRCAKAL
jgi:formylglycine-generating enzyme required for sulfatase activity/serine/threonine protein kinase